MDDLKSPDNSGENPMKLDVRILSISENGNPVARVSLNINDCFAVKNISLMNGKNGLFVSMPSYKTSAGEYKDICFPLTKEFRDQINSEVINAYEQKLENIQSQAQEQSSDMDSGMTMQ